jgi:hypothetical protein
MVGNMDEQFAWMKEKAESWADKIRTGHLPRHLTWMAWTTTILKTLEYPLPVTTLSKKQCDKITSILANTALPRCGFMRSFPRALMHAPLAVGGLNVPNLYTEQGIGHITRLIRYSQSRHHSTGKLLRFTCEAFKLQMGCNGNIFSFPTMLSTLATNSWIKSTWEFAQENQITIMDDIPDLQPLRIGDRLIIPTLAILGFSAPDLALINQCRLFLQVSWISECVTADGQRLERRAFQFPYHLDYIPYYHYPEQHCPANRSWQLWTQAFKLLCGNNGRLQDRLGPWLDKERIRWWFDPPTDRLYEISNEIILEYRSIRGKTHSASSRFSPIGTTTRIPATACPASAFKNHQTACVTGTGLLATTETRVAPFDDIQWILERNQNPEDFYQKIRNGEGDIRGVSDGSFKNSHGTAAWIIKIGVNSFITGGTIVPGPPEIQCAYRSELTGLYGIACTIWSLEQSHGLISTITVGCDGLSALQQVNKISDFIDPNMPHFDLILATRQMISRTHWSWEWTHVKGHQDSTTAIEDLNEWSRLNIQMDTEAKRLWKDTEDSQIDPTIPGEPWRVSIMGKKIITSMRDKLRETINTADALTHWDKKQRFREGKADCIDWLAFGAAMKAETLGRRRWVSKTVSGFCATGRMMFRRKEWDSDKCPRCRQPNENTDHVWKCKQDTESLWNKSMETLKQWLLLNKTHPEIASLIINHLQAWRRDDGFPQVKIPWAKPAFEAQTGIGWKNFFEGMMSQEWQEVQKFYFTRIGSKRSPKRWTSALIRKLWQIAWDLWEHRNGFVHEREAGLVSEQINRHIQEEFQKGFQDLDTNTKILFHARAGAICKKPLEIRLQWLKRVQTARAIKQELPQAYANERRIMAAWLCQGSEEETR